MYPVYVPCYVPAARQDPYVRKTAAVCVAKLYDINAELVEDQGFLQILRDLICDPNPTVRAGGLLWAAVVLGSCLFSVLTLRWASLTGWLTNRETPASAG